MTLETVERQLLSLIQLEFPMVREPFRELGIKIGAGYDAVISQISTLKERGIVRSIGPVVDARRLGYHSTLVAMRVPLSHLDLAESIIAGHPGVSHGYERNHSFNVWFTLALHPAEDVERELERLTADTGAESAVSLPATRLFKIGAYFDVDESGNGRPGSSNGGPLPEYVKLSPTEGRVLEELQQDLPLMPEPFAPMAERLGMDVDAFLDATRSLLRTGVVRRFSASINHRRAGFVANAMCCWTVPPDRVDMIGNRLASLKEVSHCYERQTNGFWRHNLFAMVHGRSKDICEGLAEAISRETGLLEYELLYSTREFKKSRIRYSA